jgi:hypothetical protein
MAHVVSVALALVIALAALPAGPQSLPHVPHLGVVNPSLSLSPPATTPLQQQIQQDYATRLQSEQRALLRQNSSGLTPDELAVGRQLDGYTPR